MGEVRAPARPVALVAGGTGYLGRFVCVGLREAGFDVIAVARRPAAAPAGCRLYLADLAANSAGELAGFLARVRPRVVVNAAGALWEVSETEMTHSNQELVARLVAGVGAVGGRVRLVQLGSVYEYGAQPGGYALLDETTAELPITPYARSKLAGSRLVVGAIEARQLDGVVLRVSTVLGPNAPVASFFGGLAAQLARRPATVELPELSDERDFVDVRDVVSAVVKAARISATPPVLNIANGRLTPVKTLVDELIKVSGVPVRRVTRPYRGLRRDADAGRQYVDIGAARRALRWIPQHKPIDSIRGLWRSVSETPVLH
ncbi:NAD-dependent epimerase/dehydratase family protein [Nonomuraea zeae]|uniref:NAD-dependent epimerase/dehydratase family protein n=1 Tax=Nonomuraea zeae TaxID=1642303 RepID=A0A5S4GUU6_9ACTN|nr:NAD-dependent epimerase/dehydratase family protein [Nonomuraea zeae]TMR36726.1 NAD-dependent epimerase/dehydratase family protein [Nonomuraea zeae]